MSSDWEPGDTLPDVMRSPYTNYGLFNYRDDGDTKTPDDEFDWYDSARWPEPHSNHDIDTVYIG